MGDLPNLQNTLSGLGDFRDLLGEEKGENESTYFKKTKMTHTNGFFFLKLLRMAGFSLQREA